MNHNNLDERAFEELFRLHFSDLMRRVNGFVQDDEIARDIVHDTFLTLWNNRHLLDTSRPVSPYLFTLGHNLALNFLKHKRVVESHQKNVITNYEELAAEIGNYENRLARLRSKLAELPEKQLAAINKCVIDGKRYKEAAEELGITVNTLKTHIARAMKFLRDELQDDVLMLLLLTRH